MSTASAFTTATSGWFLVLAGVLGSAPATADKPPKTLSTSKTITRTIELKPHEQLCQVNMELGYEQWGDRVAVSGMLSNDTCDASHGSYTLQIKVRAGDGEVQELEYKKRWQRSDGEPIRFEEQYPLAAESTLLRVRTRSLRCICGHAEPSPDGTEPGATPAPAEAPPPGSER
jgi:hypothetical protein